MHKHHVAHRFVYLQCDSDWSIPKHLCSDCMAANIMMDGTMYPDGWHPVELSQRRDFNPKLPLKAYSRLQRPPKYYLIDFGISRRYDADERWPLELPIFGGDRTVPEFKKSPDEPCNPFPTDIYYLGNMIQLSFMEVSAVKVSRTSF